MTKNIFESPKPPVDKELLSRMQTYFSMLDNPEPNLTTDQAEEVAGEYYAKNIIGHYTPEQINLVMFMVRQ